MKCIHCGKEQDNIVIDYHGKKLEITPIESHTGKLGDLKKEHLLTFEMIDILTSDKKLNWNPEGKDIIIRNFEINYKAGYSHAIARFGFFLDGVDLSCLGDPQNVDADIWVAYWKEIGE